jgi:hypothetical protein
VVLAEVKNAKQKMMKNFGPSLKITTICKLYHKFINAYKSNNFEALGSDRPIKNKSTIDAVELYKYMLILSTADESIVLFDCEESGAFKTKYNVFSQNLMLEFKLGLL